MTANRYAKWTLLLCAAALFLAGCGGGDSGVDRSTHDMLQTDLDAALADLMEAEDERDTAQAEVARLNAQLLTANSNVASLTTRLETATADVTRLTNQIGSATDPTSLEGRLAAATADVTRLTNQIGSATDATSLQGRLATATAQVTTLRNQLATERQRVATLQGQLTTAQAQVTTAQREAQEAEREANQRIEQAETQANVNLRAVPYLAAISDGGGATPRDGVSVTYQRGSSLQINVGGNFDSGSGAPGIPGFTPRTYTREVGVEGQQTVYLYTNIQAPGARAFWKIHGLTVENAEDNAANNPRPTSAAQFIPHATDPTMAAGVRVSGTYDGVFGTFTCTVAACTGLRTGITLTDLVTLAQGMRSFGAAGDWTFTPSSILSGVNQMEDNEHLYFGIWVEEPEAPSGVHDYEYITGGMSALTNFDDLIGTARFSGGAIGKYVTRNQVGDNAKIGTFTAAADFTATLGGTPTLEGRITNFREGGQSLPGNWNVYLGTADNTPAAFAAGTVTDAVVSARIGGVSAVGTWDATLYGTANPGQAELFADDAVMYPVARYPLADLAGLVGNFNAINTASDGTAVAPAEAIAAIAGAFGATCSTTPCIR